MSSQATAANASQWAPRARRPHGARRDLGSIDDVMIDEKSGIIAYAIMSFGGFLGIGSQYHPLAWSMLSYDANLGGYVVNVERAQLKGTPPLGRWY